MDNNINRMEIAKEKAKKNQTSFAILYTVYIYVNKIYSKIKYIYYVYKKLMISFKNVMMKLIWSIIIYVMI